MVHPDGPPVPLDSAYLGVHRDHDLVFPLFPDSSHKKNLKGGILTTETTAVTMSTIMSSVGSIVSEAIKWVGQFATAITGNPLLLMFVIVGFVGLGVGLLRRLMHV